MARAPFRVYLGFMFCSICGARISDRCKGGDYCGLNSICLPNIMDGSIECRCLRGFVFVDDVDHSKGCLRSPAQQICTEKSEMQYVGTSDWPGNDYESIPHMSEAACKQECLVDCFCIVFIPGAFDPDRSPCWKKAMPLRGDFIGEDRASFVKKICEDRASFVEKICEPRKKKKRWMLIVILLGSSLGFFILGTCLVIFCLLSGILNRRRRDVTLNILMVGPDLTQNILKVGPDLTQTILNVGEGTGIQDSANVKNLEGEGNKAVGGSINLDLKSL